MTVYNGAHQRIRSGGGAVRVTIASNVGQGNGGTSLPCAGCFLTCPTGNTGPVRVNIGAAASATVGIDLPESGSANSPVFIPIDDVSKLYFYSGTNDDVVDIMYLRGV